LLLVLAALWGAHGPLLRAAARTLVVDRPLPRTDYLWLADGSQRDHVFANVVATRYRQDSSQRILVIEPRPPRLVRENVLPSFIALAQRELGRRGVPAAAIVTVPARVANFHEEALLVAVWLQTHPRARLQMLCDRFGSGRYDLILRSVLGPGELARVGVMALPRRGQFDEGNWWHNRSGVQYFLDCCLRRFFLWRNDTDADCGDGWRPEEFEQALSTGLVRRY
jgi:hypothetical protein